MAKENTTLSIDTDVKLAFKIATTMNGVDMSETVESFMLRYSQDTNKLRQLRDEKDGR
jgi:hypothetical protein